jgi:hypothetical protein
MEVEMSVSDRFARIARAIAAMIMAALRAIFGGVKEVGAAIAADVRMVGRGVRDGASHVAHVAGRGLSGPAQVLDYAAGAFGATLGALLPRRPVGPRDVADAAVGRDDSMAAQTLTQVPPAARAELHAAAMLGNAVQASAGARAAGDVRMIPLHDADLPPHLVQWLGGLSPNQLRHLGELTTWVVAAHVQGRTPIPGIPPAPAAPVAAPARDDMRAMLAQIRRAAANDRAEVAAMATRGPRPAVLPTEDDDEAYDRRRGGARPAFG